MFSLLRACGWMWTPAKANPTRTQKKLREQYFGLSGRLRVYHPFSWDQVEVYIAIGPWMRPLILKRGRLSHETSGSFVLVTTFRLMGFELGILRQSSVLPDLGIEKKVKSLFGGADPSALTN